MKKIIILLFFITSVQISFSQHLQTKNETKPDWEGLEPDGCTSITVGKLASFDGSVMTSHTDDSHRTRSEFNIVPPKKYPAGSKVMMYKRVPDNTKKIARI
jgi:Peptidase family C69.